MTNTTLLRIEKTDKQQIRVDLHEYRGRMYVGLRLWFRDDAGEWSPSERGISLRPEHVPQIIQALTLAVQAHDPKRGA
ncbi:hypothetical protein AX768_03710 [Burkholderia sp. PAMC 28687]|uniref:transcriptional coactivator p15/PC4 family protein n=1 Tax=Burkholderia sp. PAMC 28687 TaxID=1795874 RepID=UPI000781DDC1|nr:transcriptional coactivator p15/PC4 family protein [Burkholderia sp. PAMC 28687]AMM13350.1 hypothetical protein AX768_03710 [Burkholderia sp. PAMC 28687]